MWESARLVWGGEFLANRPWLLWLERNLFSWDEEFLSEYFLKFISEDRSEQEEKEKQETQRMITQDPENSRPWNWYETRDDLAYARKAKKQWVRNMGTLGLHKGGGK